MYMNQAYLLNIDGQEILVENHPSIHVDEDFNDICSLVDMYGSDKIKELVKEYRTNGQHRDEILNYYCQNWCKVRTWGTFCDEVTFRIISHGTNWYNTILQFLLNHPMYSNSKIAVESDKPDEQRRLYWNNISYQDAINPENEEVLASKLPSYESLIIA